MLDWNGMKSFQNFWRYSNLYCIASEKRYEKRFDDRNKMLEKCS